MEFISVLLVLVDENIIEESVLNRCCGNLDLKYMVYVYSRFEHSLGVYRLATDALQRIKKYQGLELGIESFDVQKVKLAGLLHDVDHGPFSQIFECEFVPSIRAGMRRSHEENCTVDEHIIDIDSDNLKTAKEMKVASEEGKSVSSKEKQFWYEIVANGTRGIDYEICYWAKEYLTNHKLFPTRADLHRTVYMHPKVKAIELMVVDVLINANDHLQIASDINEPAQYWMLDDATIKTIETSSHQGVEDSRILIRRIWRRDIYQDYDIKDDQISHLLPACYQDMFVRVHTRELELVEAVSKAFENVEQKELWVEIASVCNS